MQPPDKSARRSRRQVWILFGLFFAPLALAFLLYYGAVGWRPAGSTNRGELIDPPRPLPSVELQTAAGPPLVADAWRGKWTLVHVSDGRCDARCREALTLIRQTRLALNADMQRVQRVLLVVGNCCDQHYFDTEHPGLTLARVDNDAGARLLAAFPDAQSGAIYVVDPLGNLMMSHPVGTAPKGLLEDLKKLLKLSHIG
jgi:hypothetical protein